MSAPIQPTDKLLQENTQLRDQLLKLTQKLVEVETKRAELEEEFSNDNKNISILHSLDEANKVSGKTKPFKPSIKPVVGKECLRDGDVVKRITYYVETVNKYFGINYDFSFKNGRQYDYLMKLLGDKMSEARSRLEFLNEVKDEYKNLLDSKCRQDQQNLHRIQTQNTLATTNDLQDDDFSRLKAKYDKLRVELRAAKAENLKLREEVSDHVENRRSALKQKEALYEQYEAIKEENERLIKINDNEGVMLLTKHLGETLVKFIDALAKKSFQGAKMLMSIILSQLRLEEEKGSELGALMEKLENSMSK